MGSVETLIGHEVTIRGDISFSGGLHIDGKVVGAVLAEEGSEGVVTLSEKGTIEGEVRAPYVLIDGTLKGDVVATERVELASNARVEGTIYYKVVEMTAGAMLTGQLVHAEEPRKRLTGPESLKEPLNQSAHAAPAAAGLAG